MLLLGLLCSCQEEPTDLLLLLLLVPAEDDADVDADIGQDDLSDP